MPDDHTDP
jgi:RNA polymerase sigma-70 factor, ECF subfamily